MITLALSNDTSRTNIPFPLPVLYGRARELNSLAQYLEQSQSICLLGPGGIGKTCLALHAAAAYLAANTCANAWLCDFSNCASLEQFVDSLALSIKISSPTVSPLQAFALALGSQDAPLLILDGFDDLPAAATDLVNHLLDRCPDLRLILTSRSRLQLLSAVVVDLPPLSIVSISSDYLSDATSMLTELALSKRAQMGFSPEDLPFLDTIARSLQGIPLALELAASRTTVMSPRVLAHRLQNNLQILRQGKTKCLDAAVEGSFHSLLPYERNTLAQCAVFRNSFTALDAEAVVDLSQDPEAPPVIDVVQSLRDKSLIHARVDKDSELQLSIFRPILEYVAAHSDPVLLKSAQSRHADYFSSKPEYQSKTDHDNLLAIIERTLDGTPVSARRAEPALHALLRLAPESTIHSPIQSLLYRIDPVLDVTRDSGANPQLLARVLILRGSLRRRSGNRPLAMRDLTKALNIARTLGSAAIEAHVLLEIGLLLLEIGELDEANSHFENSLALSRSAKVPVTEAVALASIGRLDTIRGNLDAALPLFERASAMLQARGSAFDLIAIRLQLSYLLLDLGLYERASGVLVECQKLAVDWDDLSSLARANSYLGLLDQAKGEFASAETHLSAALTTLRGTDEPGSESIVLGFMGILKHQTGQEAEAYTLLRSAVSGIPKEQVPPELALFHCHLAILESKAGRSQDSEQNLQIAKNIFQKSQYHWLETAIKLASSQSQPLSGSIHLSIVHKCLCLSPSPKATEPPPENALVIGPLAAWIKLPNGPILGLERRRPLSKIIARLSQAAKSEDYKPLAWDELLAAGWPGEKVQAEAGAHRVRVAISTLRKLGLGDLLQTTESGYALSSKSPLVELDSH